MDLFDVTGADVTTPADADGDLGDVTVVSATVNGGSVLSSPGVGAAVVVNSIGIIKGDVTGNGDITSADAQATLQLVSSADTSLPSAITGLGVQTGTAPWSGAGTVAGRLLASKTAEGWVVSNPPTGSTTLNTYSAFAVADVDEDGTVEGFNLAAGDVGGVTAVDAAEILRFAVGIVGHFGELILPPLMQPSTAPGLIATNLAEMFRVSSTSPRPGAQVTVSLHLADVRDLYAGELRLEYDHAALRPVDVRIESAAGSPLIAHSTKSGDLGIAFASAHPIENGVLHAVFEAAPGASDTVPAHVSARRLVLNRTRIDTDFEHRFLIERYQFQLMANYPNPFNPETWIPFELAEDADVTIRIYGVDGTRVRTLELGRQPQGVYASRDQAAHWDGSNDHGERVASGVYMYEIIAGDYHATRRMVVMK